MYPLRDCSVDRRSFLGSMGIVLLGVPVARRQTDEQTDEPIVVEQGDRCIEITPFVGGEPVEELYEYTYPERFDGPPGSTGDSFSSEGTTDLQRDRTSILFLYDGPEGRSLVLVHGRLDGEEDAGGLVSFSITGLPSDGRWVVRDDYYLTADGEQAASNFDRWDVEENPHRIDWVYRAGRTDGGAFRDLGSDFEVRIEPGFNDDARLANEHDFGPIEYWEVLSGDRQDPDRFPLELDHPVTVRRGRCDSDVVDVDSPTETETPEEAETPDETETPEESPSVTVDEDTDDSISAAGDVVVAADVEVDGNVEAGRNVDLRADAEVDGNVEAGGNVLVGPDAEIDGNVEAGGTVVLEKDAEIDGNVEAGGDVILEADAEIDGNVEAGGDVRIDQGAEVDGNVSGVTVDIAGSASVDGNVSTDE